MDDIWIPLGETYLIEKFQPVWNYVVEGFGIKTPGIRRKQNTSLWDTLHPGRAFVTRLELPPNPKSAQQIAVEVQQFFALSSEARTEMAVRDDGEEPDDETG